MLANVEQHSTLDLLLIDAPTITASGLCGQ
jgi:hypothetical protein